MNKNVKANLDAIKDRYEYKVKYKITREDENELLSDLSASRLVGGGAE